MSQGFALNTIAPAMVALGNQGTLAQVYANLSGSAASGAWPAFLAAVQALPGVTSDDPFGGASQPAQLTHIAPWTVELAGKVFAAILSDIVQGKEAHQMNASVRAVLASAPNAHRLLSSAVSSAAGSRRLRPPAV
jgi:hypothetical protein